MFSPEDGVSVFEEIEQMPHWHHRMKAEFRCDRLEFRGLAIGFKVNRRKEFVLEQLRFLILWIKPQFLFEAFSGRNFVFLAKCQKALRS